MMQLKSNGSSRRKLHFGFAPLARKNSSCSLRNIRRANTAIICADVGRGEETQTERTREDRLRLTAPDTHVINRAAANPAKGQHLEPVWLPLIDIL